MPRTVKRFFSKLQVSIVNNQLTNVVSDDQVNQTGAKPRVLFLVGFLWGDEGISVGLVRLAQALMKHGWEVAVASAIGDNIKTNAEFIRGPEWFESHGIKHFFVPTHNFRIFPGNLAAAFKALLSLNVAVRQFRPDVINVHSLSMCPYAQVIRLLYKIPFASTARIEPITNRRSVKLSAFINRHFNSFLGDRFIAISTEVKDVYEQILKVPKEKTRLVCHGVDNDYFRPPSPQEQFEARQAFGLTPDSKVVCLIGRLDPVKGHDVLYRALAILKSEGIDITALCAGTGGQWKEEIQAKATEVGVGDRVRFLGFADTRQVLWASDILTLPSRREGFGWVIVEAMLCGVVPIRTPSAGATDQIEDGINGFLVPFDDAKALAMRFKQLVENEARMSQMSLAAIESARQKFTADRMAKNTIAVYEELMNVSSPQ